MIDITREWWGQGVDGISVNAGLYVSRILERPWGDGPCGDGLGSGESATYWTRSDLPPEVSGD